MPREIDAILDDAEDVRIPTWKRVGDFEVLDSPEGFAVLYNNMGMIRFPDGVCVAVSGHTYDSAKNGIAAALRERPVSMKTLDLEEEPSLPPPPEPDDFVDPLLVDEAPKPSPRQWRVVPISQGDDD